MRKGILVGVAALLPLVAPAASFATATLYTTSGAQVTCNSVIGTIKISPPLTFNPSVDVVKFKVAATLGGCSVTGTTVPAAPPLTIQSGALSGTLIAAAGTNCGSLLSGATGTGNLVIKWKPGKDQKLDFSSTTVTPGTLNAGIAAPYDPSGPTQLGTGNYGSFTASDSVYTVLTPPKGNAFVGGPWSFLGVTGEDVFADLANSCNGLPPNTKGVKLIHIGLGQVTF